MYNILINEELQILTNWQILFAHRYLLFGIPVNPGIPSQDSRYIRIEATGNSYYNV